MKKTYDDVRAAFDDRTVISASKSELEELLMALGEARMPLGRRAPVLPGVVREAVRKADKHHMTGKSTDLMRQLVRICKEGGRILDPFSGSGTTLFAAGHEGYTWTGIEMTRHYFDVASSRLGCP